MKSIYIRNLAKGYLKRKWIWIVGLIVFVLLFGFIGLRRAYPERLNVSLSEEVQEYNETVEAYDSAIAGLQESIEDAKEVLAEEQEYIDNSIYMQIDPEEVKSASVLYMIDITEEGTVSENNTKLNNVLNTLKSYYDSGMMEADLEERLGSEYSTYLSELLSCGIEGQAINVTVIHYDMEQASAIVDEMADLLEAYKPVVEQELGVEFNMTSMGKTERTYESTSIVSKQTSYRTALKTYRTNVTDLQSKLATQQTSRTTYIKQYAPSGASSSPRRTLLMYGAMGVLAGIIIPLIIYAVYYTLSSRIKGKEELQAANLNVLAVYRPKKGYSPDLDMTAVNLKLLSEKNNSDSLSVSTMGESDALEKVGKDLEEALSAQGMGIYKVRQGIEDADQFKKMSEIGSNVMIVEAGRTTYSQVEEQIQFCGSLDITIWGCIVIE